MRILLILSILCVDFFKQSCGVNLFLACFSFCYCYKIFILFDLKYFQIHNYSFIMVSLRICTTSRVLLSQKPYCTVTHTIMLCSLLLYIHQIFLVGYLHSTTTFLLKHYRHHASYWIQLSAFS